MFEINKQIITKRGEKLKPFLVQHGMAYCFTPDGKTVVRELDEFDFTPKKEKKTIVVSPVIEAIDEFFTEEKLDDELEVIIEPPVVEKVKVNIGGVNTLDEPIVEKPESEPEAIDESKDTDEEIQVIKPPSYLEDDDYI